VVAYPAELVDGDYSGDGHVVADRHVAGHGEGVGDGHVVADYAIVGDVAVGHDPAPSAYARRAGRAGAAVDGHVLANESVVADEGQRLFAGVFFVLRFEADGGAEKNAATFAEAGAVADHSMRADLGAVADYHVALYDCVRADGDISADLSAGVNDGGRMDLGFYGATAVARAICVVFIIGHCNFLSLIKVRLR